MSDKDSIFQDALDDEERILQENEVVEPYFYDMKDDDISMDTKINLQDALTQKYWLGRLAYELAIRSDEVKVIKEKCNQISDKVNLYDMTNYSPRSRCLVIQLEPYGFTSQPKLNLLKTEHTSYPLYLEDVDGNKMEINTRRHIEKLLGIIDGRPKTYYQLNSIRYRIIKDLGEHYSSKNNYLSLILF